MLDCGSRGERFAPVVGRKMHGADEHPAPTNKRFLCTVCGAGFKMHEEYLNHVNVHRKPEIQNIDDKNQFKRLMCKACHKRFHFLRTYYEHIKIHGK